MKSVILTGLGVLLAYGSVALAHEGAHEQARITVSPISVDYEQGEEIPVEVRISTIDPVTSVQIFLRYDPAKVQVQEITKNEEAFPFWWAQKAAEGTIELAASSRAREGVQGEVVLATVHLVGKGHANELLTVDASSVALNADSENLLAPQSAPEEQGESFEQQITPAGNRNIIFLALTVFASVGAGVATFLFVRQKKKV